jgi:hypothetical protein
VVGWETNRYFTLDLDKQTSLEEVKEIAYEVGNKYDLGNCLIVHSSNAKQFMLDLEPLQNYNLVYGKQVPWSYQQQVLKELQKSGIIGDIRYIRFRNEEKTATLRVAPKDECKPTGTPVAFIEIPPSAGNTQQGVTGENEGIREYLLMLNIGRTVEQMLRADGLLKS